jgi:hypothetical protein
LNRDFDGASNDAKFAAVTDCCLKAIRQCDPNRRGFRRLKNAYRLIAFQADCKVQRRKRGEFGLSRRVHGLKRLGVLNLRSQHDFALDNAFPLPLASIIKLFLTAAEGILSGPP